MLKSKLQIRENVNKQIVMRENIVTLSHDHGPTRRKHSYCPNGDKTWSKYHKDKIFNRNIYDQSKDLPFVFRSELHVNVGPIKIRTSPLTTTKADLLFLFVNEMK